MAFEEVSKNKYVKSNSVEVGGVIEGYVIGKHNSTAYPDIDSIVMKIGEEKVVLNPHGSLRYFFKNGNKAGFYYRFTRLESIKTPKGALSAQWKIEVDRSQTISVEATPVEQTENIPF